MNTDDTYPSPVGESVRYASRKVAQLGSLVTAGLVIEARRRAQERAVEAARSQRALQQLRAQEQADYELARATFAPALDPCWLEQADLLQTARAWSTAAAYEDADEDAATAVNNCEERLRQIHPYAMSRYDELREDGQARFPAMREVLPLFTRAPHAGGYTARHAVEAAVPDAAAPDLPPVSLSLADAEEREAATAERERASGLAASGPGNGVVAGNLDPVIAAREEAGIAESSHAHAATDRRAALLASESFPDPVADVAASAAALAGPGRPRGRKLAVARQRRRSV